MRGNWKSPPFKKGISSSKHPVFLGTMLLLTGICHAHSGCYLELHQLKTFFSSFQWKIPFQVSARNWIRHSFILVTWEILTTRPPQAKFQKKLQYTSILQTRSAIPPSPTMKGIPSKNQWIRVFFFFGGCPLRCVGTTFEKYGEKHTPILPRFCYLAGQGSWTEWTKQTCSASSGGFDSILKRV